MKKTTMLLALCLALSAGTAGADDIYVIAGGGSQGTRISSLPYTISEPGFYYLSGSLSGDHLAMSEDGIAIRADNVTLDLMGYTLSGSGSGDAIDLGESSHVVVRNGFLDHFLYGVRNTSGTGLRINDLGIRDMGERGMILTGKGNVVKDCSITNCGNDGLYMKGAGRIQDCTMVGNGASGIEAFEGCLIKDNICMENVTGINIYWAIGMEKRVTIIRGNVINDNSGNGIRMATRSMVLNNAVEGSGNIGIWTNQDSFIHGNISKNNEWKDIHLEDSTGTFYTQENNPQP